MDDISTAHNIVLILTGSGSTGLKGDVNGDGKVSISDATKVVNIVLGNE